MTFAFLGLKKYLIITRPPCVPVRHKVQNEAQVQPTDVTDGKKVLFDTTVSTVNEHPSLKKSAPLQRNKCLISLISLQNRFFD